MKAQPFSVIKAVTGTVRCSDLVSVYCKGVCTAKIYGW